jgi:hypothetical protein
MNWWQNAAEGGDGVAMREIGLLYEKGQGVPTDRSRAIGWYQKAAFFGDESAKAMLAALGIKSPANVSTQP